MEDRLLDLAELEAYREEQDCSWYFEILKAQGIVTEEDRPIQCEEDSHYRTQIQLLNNHKNKKVNVKPKKIHENRRKYKIRHKKRIHEKEEFQNSQVHIRKYGKHGKIYYVHTNDKLIRRMIKKCSRKRIRKYNKHYIPNGNWCNRLFDFWNTLY